MLPARRLGLRTLICDDLPGKTNVQDAGCSAEWRQGPGAPENAIEPIVLRWRRKARKAGMSEAWFRRLAAASAIGVVVPIVLGGIVRATGSGDACPDWPRCFGRWIPPGNYKAILEYTHRVAAALAGIALLALALSLVSKKSLRSSRALSLPALAAFVLVLLQSYLGKLVVERALAPGLVTLHLATALGLASVVTVAAVNARFVPSGDAADDEPDPKGRPAVSGVPSTSAPASRTVSASSDSSGEDGSAPEGRPPPDAKGGARSESRVWWLGIASVAAISAVILVGAYMRAEGASLAFSDWPLMGGALLPTMRTEPERVHFGHRLLVALGSIPVVAYAVAVTRDRRYRGPIVGFAHAAAGLYVLEIALGAATVLTKLQAWARAGHVAVASVCLMCAVASVTYLSNTRSLAEAGSFQPEVS